MTEFQGTFFDGRSSRGHPVTAVVADGRLVLHGDEIRKEAELSGCRVEPALGSTRRTLYTPDGGRLDTPDTAAFEAVEGLLGGKRGLRWVHLLESHWKAALGAVGFLLLFVWAASAYGLPLLAKGVAFALPAEMTQPLGRAVLERVDGVFLLPSELDPGRKREIRRLLADFTAEAESEVPYELVFRKSRVGPNAFALPHGVVVLTDEMVDFVQSDDELVGVLAHELAHLENRHGLRSLLQNAGVFVMVSALVGDVVSITSVAGTLPTILIEARYSRGFEQEADRVAARQMLRTGRGVEPMIAFLARMGERHPQHRGPDLASTHPAVQKRISQLEALGGSFRP